jgi:hypothetical protein
MGESKSMMADWPVSFIAIATDVEEIVVARSAIQLL